MVDFIERNEEKLSSDTRLLRTFLEIAEYDRKVMEAVEEGFTDLLRKVEIKDIREGNDMKVRMALDDPAFEFASPGQAGGGEGDRPGEGGEDAGEEAASSNFERSLPPEKVFEFIFDLVDLPVEARRRLRGTIKKFSFRGTQREGPPARLDKDATYRRKLAREIKLGKEDLPFRSSDRRFKRVSIRKDKQPLGRVYIVRDKSGSMKSRVELVKPLLILVYSFLHYKYKSLELIFIAHDTDAHVVEEEEFWDIESQGGTRLSSGLRKVVEMEESDRHTGEVYVFHFTDGDNTRVDNDAFVKAMEEVLKLALYVGFVEIKPYRNKFTKKFFIDSKRAMFHLRSLYERYGHLHLARFYEFEDVGDAFMDLFEAGDRAKSGRRLVR